MQLLSCTHVYSPEKVIVFEVKSILNVFFIKLNLAETSVLHHTIGNQCGVQTYI